MFFDSATILHEVTTCSVFSIVRVGIGEGDHHIQPLQVTGFVDQSGAGLAGQFADFAASATARVFRPVVGESVRGLGVELVDLDFVDFTCGVRFCRMSHA